MPQNSVERFPDSYYKCNEPTSLRSTRTSDKINVRLIHIMNQPFYQNEKKICQEIGYLRIFANNEDCCHRLYNFSNRNDDILVYKSIVQKITFQCYFIYAFKMLNTFHYNKFSFFLFGSSAELLISDLITLDFLYTVHTGQTYLLHAIRLSDHRQVYQFFT